MYTLTQQRKCKGTDLLLLKKTSNSNMNEENSNKLDGVGPVDNRPSTEKLHHFVWKNKKNKTKVISANLMDFAFDLDFYFEDIFRFGNILVLVTFQFRWHFSFDDILVLVTF